MIKYPIWFTCSLRSFWHLNVMGPFWVFLMEKWHLNIIQNFLTQLGEVITLSASWTTGAMKPAVGGITVCYGTHLQSPVLWARSYHQDCIIFGFSFYIQNSAKILVELEIWIFKSDPSLVVDILLNQDYSGDSNGGICVTIPALGDENRDLPCFCLPTLPRKSPWGIGSYYTPLERYS